MKIFVLAADVDFTAVRADGEGRIISVFLSRGKGKHNWRCNECGRIVFQYTGEPSFIFDGAIIPEERAEINILCHRCKICYRVISI